MTTHTKYFGTDGIRGRVGGDVINPEFMLRLGWAAGCVLASEDCNRVVIGKDTRQSGNMLQSALQKGLSAAGTHTLLCGSIPTPAVAYLTRTLHACAGIVVSASHNPHHDNGIKFFNHQGHKLSDEVELAIEAMLEKPLVEVAPADMGKVQQIDNADAQYIEFCKSSIPPELSLTGLKIVVDCANGAAYQVAPRVFAELGAEVITIGNQPDGLNINRDCGATSLSALQDAVVSQQADLGIALDGDADRLIMVDHEAAIVDGDAVLYIIAGLRLKLGEMRGAVVGTLMSNLGLEQAIERLGLQFVRENVGDRYVSQRLMQDGGILGGESSGHIVCLDKTTTGDGIISALQVLHAMQLKQQTLAELRSGMQSFPQTLINVPIAKILSPAGLVAADKFVRAAEDALNGCGRILLRPSGTEPVIRVMVEGQDQEQIERVAQQLADQVATQLRGQYT